MSKAKSTSRTKSHTMRIRKDDQVQIMSGKDRGKRGRVLRVSPATERVFVEGLNMQKRHTRPSALPGVQGGTTVGGVIEREGPVHVSNVMVVDPKTGKPTRVGVTRTGGTRVRVAKISGTPLD
jgi:large subunit ribosomal protein L24